MYPNFDPNSYDLKCRDRLENLEDLNGFFRILGILVLASILLLGFSSFVVVRACAQELSPAVVWAATISALENQVGPKEAAITVQGDGLEYFQMWDLELRNLIAAFPADATALRVEREKVLQQMQPILSAFRQAKEEHREVVTELVFRRRCLEHIERGVLTKMPRDITHYKDIIVSATGPCNDLTPDVKAEVGGLSP